MAIGDVVKGERYEGIMRKLFEIGRQVHQRTGYQFDAEKLDQHLQDATEGIFELVAKRDWPVWKTIIVKTGLMNSNEYRGAIKAVGYKITDSADLIISMMAVRKTSEEIELKLAMATGTELTGRSAPLLKQVLDAIKNSGGRLLTAESALLLRSAYDNQPKGEWFLVATEPVKDAHNRLGMFIVGHYTNGGVCVDAEFYSPDTKDSGDYKWVFAINK